MDIWIEECPVAGNIPFTVFCGRDDLVTQIVREWGVTVLMPWEW